MYQIASGFGNGQRLSISIYVKWEVSFLCCIDAIASICFTKTLNASMLLGFFCGTFHSVPLYSTEFRDAAISPFGGERSANASRQQSFVESLFHRSKLFQISH
jgi:hypothetical protein